MDDQNFQVNTNEASTPVSSSDSTLTSSTGGETSNAQPVTAASLVENYFSQTQPSQAENESPPIPEAEPDVADSAVSPEDAPERGYKSLEDAINDIRGLRENRKALEPKAKQYDALLGQFEQIGLTQDLIEPGMQILGGLLATTEEGERTTAPFFDQLEEVSQPILRQLLDDVTNRYPSYLLDQIGRDKALEALGLNPALYDTYAAVNPDGSLGGQTVGGYDASILQSIPDHLRDTYKSLPANKQFQLDGMEPEDRIYELQEKFDLAELKREKADQQRREAEAQAKAEEHAADVRLQNFINEQNQAFMGELEKSFSPFGADKPGLNKFFQNAIFHEVSQKLESDPQTAVMLKGLGKAARSGDDFGAQRILAQLNVHIAKHRNARIEELNNEIFSVIQNKGAQSRAAAANQTAVNGMGGFSGGHQTGQPPAFGTPEYYEWMLANNGVRF